MPETKDLKTQIISKIATQVDVPVNIYNAFDEHIKCTISCEEYWAVFIFENYNRILKGSHTLSYNFTVQYLIIQLYNYLNVVLSHKQE